MIFFLTVHSPPLPDLSKIIRFKKPVRIVPYVYTLHGFSIPSSGVRQMISRGLFCTVAASVLWGTAGPVMRIADSLGVDILTLNLVRALFASSILCLVALVRKRSGPGPVARKRVTPLLLLGAAGMVISALGLNLAFLRLSIGLAMVLYYSAPLWVMAGSWLIGRERPSIFQGAAFALALAGIWISAGGARQAGTLDMVGAAGALAGAMGYALYVLNGKYGTDIRDPFGSFSLTYLLSTAVLFFLAVAAGDISAIADLGMPALLVLMYLGLVTSLVPYGLLVLSLRWISVNTASVSTMTEVPFSMMWAWIIASELPETSAVSGGAVVLLAIAFLAGGKR